MSKAHLTALVSAVLFLRWLATGHVALTVAGPPSACPRWRWPPWPSSRWPPPRWR